MAGETLITVTGNLTGDPELRFTPSGAGVANFTVASTPRHFDKDRNEWVDGEAMFLNCSAWRQQGENVAESLQKGNRVIVQGNLKSRSYETKEGEKRTVMELEVVEIGASLKTATAKVTKAARSGGGQQSAGQDPWATQGSSNAQASRNDGWGGNTPQSGSASGGGQAAAGGDPWATSPAAKDEPPF